jgi:hypothetical protein
MGSILYLKQSTASQTRQLGPFVDATDGFSAETGLTIANTDIRLSSNGGAFGNKNSGGGTHTEDGYYTATFDATDTGTVGHLLMNITVSGARPVRYDAWVLEEDIYEALFASGAAAFDSADGMNLTKIGGNATAGLLFKNYYQSVVFKANVSGTPTSTTVDLTGSVNAPATDDALNGMTLWCYGGTGVGQIAVITSYLGASTKIATFTPAMTTVMDNTSDVIIHPWGFSSVEALLKDAQSAADLKDFADAGYDPATNKVQGVVLVDTTTTNSDMRGTDSAALASVCTEARLAELDAANLPADVDNILTDTGTTLDGKIDTIDTNVDSILVDTGTTLDDHLTDIKGTGFVKDTHSLIDIETYVDILDDGTSGNSKIATDVAAVLVDTGTTLDGKIDTIDTNVDSILVDTGTTLDDHLTDIKGTGFVKDTHSLIDIETFVDILDDGTSGNAKIATDAAAILVDTADMQPKLGTPAADVSADIAAVKAETALIVADTNELQTDDVPGLIAALNDISTAQVNTEVDSAIVTYGLDHLVQTSVVGGDIADNSIIAYMASKSATADWDSFVNTTDALEAIADMSAPSAATIADAVWDEAQADHVAAGSFGVTASEIASVLVDTAEIGTAGAGLTDLGGMSTGMKAEVNTEVADVMNTDTYTEVSAGAPTDTPTFSGMVRELYWAWKNKKTVTASTLTVRNSADAADLHTAPLSDDGTTFSKGEFGA